MITKIKTILDSFQSNHQLKSDSPKLTIPNGSGDMPKVLGKGTCPFTILLKRL